MDANCVEDKTGCKWSIRLKLEVWCQWEKVHTMGSRQCNCFLGFFEIGASHYKLLTACFPRTLKYAFHIILMSPRAMVYSSINRVGEVYANLLRARCDQRRAFRGWAELREPTSMYLALKWPFDSLAASAGFVAIAIHRICGGHLRSNRTVYVDARRKVEG